MPERSSSRRHNEGGDGAAAPVRSFWSGTIAFGLVSIPVDLLAATRPRQKAMRLVDRDGHALGRQYRCSKDGKRLTASDIVRGFETDEGEVLPIEDDELAALAPESSREIELRSFVPLEQIPPSYYQRPYFLAPAGRSAKAYHLLARTMERTGRVAIGRFVMRGHEYLAALIAEDGVLRAQTLRHAQEIRSPEAVGLPKRTKPPASQVARFSKHIETALADRLDMAELEDRDAAALQALAQEKYAQGRDVIALKPLTLEREEDGAQIIDLMQVLRDSLSKRITVASAQEADESSRPGERRQAHRGANGHGGRRTRAAQRAASASRTPRKSHGKRPADARRAPAPARKDARGSRSRSERAGAHDLRHASKAQLQKLAAELHIAGRSKMDKRTLAAAIRRAG